MKIATHSNLSFSVARLNLFQLIKNKLETKTDKLEAKTDKLEAKIPLT